jgi:phage tail-like protein
MDVNGTRLHVVLGQRDFAPLVAASRAPEDRVQRWLTDTGVAAAEVPEVRATFRPLAWDDAWGGIGLVHQLPRLRPPGGQPLLHPEDRRGAGADAFGNVFWVAGDRTRIRVRPAGLDVAGDYWATAAVDAASPPSGAGIFRPETAPDAPAPLPLLSGLAVTTAHYLVAGTLAPAGLLIFDLHSAGEPCWWRWPEALGFAPWDLAPTADGGVLILDRAAGGGRLWRLDRTFAVVDLTAPLVLAPARPEDFHAEGAPPRVRGPELFAGPVDIAAASPLDAEDPVAVLELADASALVLDAGAPGTAATVQRWRGARRTNTVVLDAAATRPHLGAALTGAHDFTALADPDAAAGTASGRLLLVTAEAAQAFALCYLADGDELSLTLEPTALPLQRFAGKALVSAGTQAFYDSAQRDPAGERWIALTEQPRYRYFPEAVVAGDADGEVLVFDGKQPGCVWHRVLLDACIPGGCQVRIESRASDERVLLDELAWDTEPAPYRRGDGSELPFHRPFGGAAATDLRLGTFETLLQAATGRYLALRLTLTGDGRASPRLRALRVYYPRFSYLHEYLPGAYREEQTAAGFLDRYLCNPEGIFTAVEGRIERAETVLDPAVAPADYLPWLSSWLGVMLNESWDEARQRLFLRYAWLLFRWRGTPAALQAWLRLATEPAPDESIFAPLAQERPGCAPGYGAGRLRIVESFELRRYRALLLGDAVAAPVPALLGAQGPWQPRDGALALHARFAQFLRARYGESGDAGDGPALQRLSTAWGLDLPYTDFNQVRFSAVLPANTAKADDWLAFARDAFDFTYAPVRTEDTDRYREFLARRYGHIDALNQAYGRSGTQRWASFTAVALPAEDALPADGTPLSDWIQFVSLALPIARDAHRFFVLAPACPSEPSAQREQRAAHIEALVRREKPAHTDFEVKLFWALFQVGTARLGIDSVLGEGGRFVAMVLDAGYLGEGYLAEGYSWSATGRTVVGRDRMQG